LKLTPVNRLSIGIQSFIESDLKYLGRNHTATQGILSLQMLKEKGFENISADLIYGIPDLSMNNWHKNLATIDSFDLQHISAYALTVEERTLLEYNLRKKKTLPASESLYIDQYQSLKEYTSRKGYLHYEISNFAKTGFISRHNTSYWTGEHYIGIGPSAHSFNGISRQWNFSRIGDYIEAMNKNDVFYEKEELSEKQKFNEYILTGFRTMWGCNSELIRQKFGKISADYFLKAVKNYVDTGLIKRHGDTYILSDEGELLTDAITTELFIDQ
jgi:oxygen-independent coproporphyrinogen III oxidase